MFVLNHKIFYKTLKKTFCSTKSNILKDQLFKMSLANIKKFGWNDYAIKVAANDLGYNNQMSGVFENGIVDIIYKLLSDWNSRFEEEYLEEKKHLNTLLNKENLKEGIKLRLTYQIPHIDNWGEAIQIGFDLYNLNTTLSYIWETIDILIGRQNCPISIRIMLIKIYLLTGNVIIILEIHMLTDKSFNHVDTWGTLETLLSWNLNVLDKIVKVCYF